MGMDMMYYEQDIGKQRFKQATNALEEIGALIDTFYNRQSRTSLMEENDKLREENLKLKQELSFYKKIIDDIKIVQSKGDNDDKICD